MYVQVIAILSIVTIFTVAKDYAINESCMTPNNETAKCIPFDNCTVIVDGLTINGTAAAVFATKSQCGYDSNLDQFLVCCGTTAYFKPKTQSSTNFRRLFTKPTTKKPGIVLAEFDSALLPERTVCGIGKETPRIAGGAQANINEFPWTAALEYINVESGQNVGVKCGGTLINKQYVLTAAHCLTVSEFKVTAVRLGEWNISGDPSIPDCFNEECTDGAQVYNISEAIPHPFHTSRTQNEDIGLIRIDGEVTYTDSIRPICMPPKNLPAATIGHLMMATGWGDDVNRNKITIKQKVELPLLENEYCNTYLPTKINHDQLCAGGKDGKDTCQGDSGGPLMRTYSDSINQERWYLEGIVSKGSPNCGKGTPGVYTRVSRYLNWIDTILSEKLHDE